VSVARRAAALALGAVLAVWLCGCALRSHVAAAPAPKGRQGFGARPAAPRTEPLLPRTLVPYTGTVYAIFFHPLIVYPRIAFSSNEALGLQKWMVTVSEFDRILPQLDANGFILISPYDLFSLTNEDGRQVVVRKTLLLPPGKKPLLLSIDDLNYYTYMRQDGLCQKLVIDASGNIAALCPTPSGVPVISEGDTIIGIVHRFVEAHPGFSFDGAEGMINETGYEGVLGYRTEAGSPDRMAQIAAARPVIARLKEEGWIFASHSFGHYNDARITLQQFAYDTTEWMQQVEPLIGPTPFYVYPFGATVPPFGPKMALLVRDGFVMMFGVGPDPAWQWHPTFVTLDRVHVDGLSLLTEGPMLAPYFDAATVIDRQERGLSPTATSFPNP